jgi:hypothetical protein
MPVPGERKVRDGVLGEFDGQTWRMVAEPGTRKTKSGVTAEWDGSTWREIGPDEASSGSALGPLGVAATDAGRRGVVYAAEQVATAPATKTLVRAATSSPARALIGGAVGGWPGAVVGQVARVPAPVVEGGIRSGAGLVAQAAGSKLATALTSPLAMVATMPLSEAGDRPLNETPAKTMERQRQFEADAKRLAEAKAERLRTGDWETEDYVEAAIAAILGRGKSK